jgi:MoaA/NifB/PqqE/SkfB family radical SAM enzyme
MQFMDPKLVLRVAMQIDAAEWNCRIGFGTHGEPSLNKKFIEIIKTVRTILPKHHLSMISNGAGFMKDFSKLDAAMEAGLNVLMLDDYGHSNLVTRIKDGYKGKLYFYPEDIDANPHRRRKIYQHHIVVLQSLDEARKGNHSRINNRAGCAFPPNRSKKGKRCANPFRDFTVRFNGNVPMCCVDFRGRKCGNVVEQTIEEIWNGPIFQSARRFMYHGMRSSIYPCLACDAIGYRLGFLPDKKGQEWIPEPDAHDRKVMDSRKAEYCVPIRRLPWERS